MYELLERIRALGKDRIAPPLTFELVMRDKRSFFIHSVLDLGEGPTLTVRVWDMRDFTDADFAELKEALIRQRQQPIVNAEELHPKLDWGILGLNIHEVAYHIEWHNRWWSLPVESKATPPRVQPFGRVEPFSGQQRNGGS